MRNKYYGWVSDMVDDNLATVDIGHRGGSIKIRSNHVFQAFGIPFRHLDKVPSYIGAGCNYLGGGVRGAIFTVSESEYINHGVPKKYAKILARVGDAFKIKYMDLENGMNEEYDEDGEPNWDAMATNMSRRAGVRSAY